MFKSDLLNSLIVFLKFKCCKQKLSHLFYMKRNGSMALQFDQANIEMPNQVMRY